MKSVLVGIRVYLNLSIIIPTNANNLQCCVQLHVLTELPRAGHSPNSQGGNKLYEFAPLTYALKRPEQQSSPGMEALHH